MVYLWALAILVGANCYIILNNLRLQRRLYLTDKSVQIVSLFKRDCIALSDIRSLLIKDYPNRSSEYLIQSVDNIYFLGKLKHCHGKQQKLALLSQKTGLKWISITKYIPQKPS